MTAQRALGHLLCWVVLERAAQLVSQEHGAPVPSQVCKLLTTGRCGAAQSDTESLSPKILPGREGPGGPRTEDVGRLPEGPPKALISSQNMRLS